jgi:hypothetical protein
MRSYAKHFLLATLLVGFCVSFSGCLKAEITTGKQPSNETVELPWAHGLIFGIVPPLNSPLQVGDQCENGISKVYFRQTFIQGIVQGFAQSIYTPQHFTVTCAAGGSMSSLKAPPSYLLRNAQDGTPPSPAAASAQQTAAK